MAGSMLTENPYLGPRTFGRTDSDRFFGREREARDLFSLIASERLVLFYAQSGAGKSSLLNARIVPRLEEHGYTVLPVARVSGELPEGVSSVDNIFAYNLMIGMLAECSTPERFASMELKDFMAALVTDDGQVYRFEEAGTDADGDDGYEESYSVLLIDQFEEIITTHQDRWQERRDFFRQLNDAMVADPKLWVLLTLREDFVAALEPYAPLLTDKLRARFYMQRMTETAALQAIKDPAALAGRPFTPDAAQTLVDNLREIQGQQEGFTQLGQFVEPVQLQVVCYQLWEDLAGKAADQITKQDLAQSGDVDASLSRFYEDAIAQVISDSGGLVSALELRNWFQNQLITEAGTRGSVYQGAAQTAGLDNSVVQQLSAQFLLRSEQRAGGTWYELIHDRFINPILKANLRWREEQGEILQDAELWHDEKENPDKLYKGFKLIGAQMSYHGQKDSLEPLVRDFLKASTKKRRKRVMMGLAILAALAILFIVWIDSLDFFNPAVVFTPDGQQLVVTSNDFDNTIYIWNLADASADPTQLTGHTDSASAAAISPNGERLATGSGDNIVRLWDLTDLAKDSERLMSHCNSVVALAFSSDGQLLASASQDASIAVWYLDEKSVIESLTKDVLEDYEQKMADCEVIVDTYPYPSTTLTATDMEDVDQVAFSADGRYLVAVDKRDSVLLWDLDDLDSEPQTLIFEGFRDE